ncbi:MAG: hypothetical protein PHS82_15785 [Lachnospiraceae bacterium]|nr:hypothetical protein [Lachnospiraceae bacterium]
MKREKKCTKMRDAGQGMEEKMYMPLGEGQAGFSWGIDYFFAVDFQMFNAYVIHNRISPMQTIDL